MRFKKEEDVKIIPVEMSEIPKVQKWSQKRTKRMLVEEFIASGYEAVRIDERESGQSARNFASSLCMSIRTNKISGVKVVYRGDDVYLVRISEA